MYVCMYVCMYVVVCECVCVYLFIYGLFTSRREDKEEEEWFPGTCGLHV